MLLEWYSKSQEFKISSLGIFNNFNDQFCESHSLCLTKILNYSNKNNFNINNYMYVTMLDIKLKYMLPVV